MMPSEHPNLQMKDPTRLRQTLDEAEGEGETNTATGPALVEATASMPVATSYCPMD